jgi:RHS repeat-associated protein
VKDWKSYPWGQSQTAPVYTWGWDDPTTTGASDNEDDLIPRGFTGHEMMDDLGLINMNGRIYDPRLGRFLSADLMVTDPGNLQSFNRYTYVRNNPLSFVDPSGFEDEKQEEANREKARAFAKKINLNDVKDPVERLSIAYARMSDKDQRRFIQGFKEYQRLQNRMKEGDKSMLDRSDISTGEEKGNNQRVGSAPPTRSLDGPAPSHGTGGPGGTIQDGTDDPNRNCASASLAVEQNVNWPNMGENGDFRKAGTFVPRGFKEVPNDGATTTTTRAGPGEREVIVYIYTHPSITEDGRLVMFNEFHMIGREVGQSASTWESKRDVGPSVNQISDQTKTYTNRTLRLQELTSLCLSERLSSILTVLRLKIKPCNSRSLMKTLALFVAVLMLAHTSMSSNSDSNVRAQYAKQWAMFLEARTSVGDDVASVDKLIGSHSADTMNVRLGGTGNFERFYLIDDFSQIRASFNAQGKLTACPMLMPRGRWLKFPDGEGCDVDAVIDSDALDKLLNDPDALNKLIESEIKRQAGPSDPTGQP